MATQLRRRLIEDFAPANGQPIAFDLPVNPLSVLLVHVQHINENIGAEPYTVTRQALKSIPRLQIQRRGVNIWDGPLEHLAVLNALLTGWAPWRLGASDVVAGRRTITVPLCFGRRPYDPAECLPGAERGQQSVILTCSTSSTGLDAPLIDLETIELPEARPTRFIRAVRHHTRRTGAGRVEIRLPRSRKILGVMTHDATAPRGSTGTSKWGVLSIELDGTPHQVMEVNWQTLHGELLRRCPGLWSLEEHVHDTLADYGEVGTLTSQQRTPLANVALLDELAYLDFDPLDDGSYALDTTAAKRALLVGETTTGTAVGLDAYPVELIELDRAGS